MYVQFTLLAVVPGEREDEEPLQAFSAIPNSGWIN